MTRMYSSSLTGRGGSTRTVMSSYLPQDVVRRILARLPPKSLLRCRAVCKSWLSLIGSADYVSNNLLNDSILTTAGHEMLVVMNTTATSRPGTRTFSFLSYETLEVASQTPENLPKPVPPGISVVGCCNGLICFYDFLDSGDIFLWNPATSEFKVLPSEMSVDTVCFGFDHRREEFKVLRILDVVDERSIGTMILGYPAISFIRQAEVYSLRSGSSWRKLVVDGDVPALRSGWYELTDRVPDLRGLSARPDLAYANGVCYWRTLCHVEGEKVTAFHFTEEVFRATQLPDASLLSGHTDRKALTVLNESVGMMVVHNESFDIWVLLEFGVMESWTRLLRIETFPGLGSPLGFWKKGELFMENSKGELVLFDPSLQTVRNLQVDGTKEMERKKNKKKKKKGGMKESLQVIGYTPSWISIGGGFELFRMFLG